MSRAGFDNKTGVHMPVPHHPSSFHGATLHGGTLHEAKDERGSMSDSEESYGQYHDIGKGEFETEDDHTALTSQTLNTDGTPKRPMNAFMIFARRRRPQVSAENQAMRTGEISKILSKEWNSMGTAEKQFYQDQARQLKDTFNTKYPDYVYRRRPNNSRRRRKPDASGHRPSENNPSIDSKDEMGGFEDIVDSPTEAEELLTPDGIPEMHSSRVGQDLRMPSDHHQPPPRTSPYVYPPHENPTRPNVVHDGRLTYDPHSRILQDTSGHSPHVNPPYPYIAAHNQARAQNQSVHMYNQASMGGNGNWNQSSLRQPSWTGSNDQAERAFTTLSGPKIHRSSTSPTNWQRQGHTAGNVSAGSPALTLSTLNSPFFPVGSPQEAASPSSHGQSISPASYNSGHIHTPILLDREYEAHELAFSSSLANSGQQYPPGTGRDGIMYANRQATEPRGLPSISNYSQSQSFTTNPGLSGPQGYWTRD